MLATALPVGVEVFFQHPPVGDRLTAAARIAILSRACRMAVDRLVDRPLRVARHAPDKGEIAALQRPFAAMIGELRGQRAVGAVGFGRDHDAGRVLVEPMHDAGPALAADAGQAVAAMGDQRVDQRAVAWPAAGCTTRPRGLLMTMSVVVFVNDVERNRLARGLRRFGRRYGDAMRRPR